MATFEEIIVWTKQLLNKPNTTAADDTGAPNNATIKAMINYERNRLYARFSAQYPARFTANADFVYTGNALQMTLPTAAQNRQLVSVFGYYDDISDAFAISTKNIAELPNLGPGGRPQCYAVESTRIYLRPMPASNQNLRIIYVPVLTALSANSDVPSEWPADHHLLLGTLAAYTLARRNGDSTAEGLGDMVKEGVELLNDTMRGMVQDDSFVRSAPPSPFEMGYF